MDELSGKIQLIETRYDDGQIFEVESYLNGTLEGDHKIWYVGGQIYQHDFYRNDKLEGECKTWHDNGMLWVKEFYRDGEREGECKSWLSDGQLRTSKFFRHGFPMILCLTLKQKCGLLKIKKSWYMERFSRITDSLIVDLAKIVQVFTLS